MTRNARSDHLHRAVRRFAAGDRTRRFLELALEIAAFQREFSPGFARLWASRRAPIESADEIPGVPCDAFRLARVALHPEDEDRLRFSTSGTTSGARGLHAMRVTETYQELALNFGRSALLSNQRAHHVVALAPVPEDPPSSSLGHMMAMFMVDFEQRGSFDVRTPERWLIDDRGVNPSGLALAAEHATERGQTLLVLATSFALVGLLDALADRVLPLPAGTVVMQTGGFKGKTREIEPAELRRAIARTFAISETQIVSEYGMTELTSQLYEATVPGSALAGERHGAPGVYAEPPWLRVVPVDPTTLEPVPSGEVGIARIVDLGNVDSAVAIQTQDRVRRVAGGIALLGRAEGAPPRGCSLAIEEFLAGGVG
ncbi:MAG TPA: acyl-protein synthetase [Polyangiaceae bacterium]|nr:acyl-protein synthetase [Polyangiaceae bacterium]